MIVGDLKPIEEIVSSISSFKKILVVGCGSCVTVCLSGGYYDNDPPDMSHSTIERQCERDFLTSYLEIPKGTEAILSLGCGAGVQTMANTFQHLIQHFSEHRRNLAYGRNSAAGAVIACWPLPEVFVRLLDVPRVSLTVRAAGPETGGVKYIPMYHAPGHLFITGLKSRIT